MPPRSWRRSRAERRRSDPFDRHQLDPGPTAARSQVRRRSAPGALQCRQRPGEGRTSASEASKNSSSHASTATIARLTSSRPRGVAERVHARPSSGCGERSTSPRPTRVRTTWEVIIGSVPAWAASSVCMTGPSAPSQVSDAVRTNWTCVSPNGRSVARCAACHRLVTCQSNSPVLSSAVANAVSSSRRSGHRPVVMASSSTAASSSAQLQQAAPQLVAPERVPAEIQVAPDVRQRHARRPGVVLDPPSPRPESAHVRLPQLVVHDPTDRGEGPQRGRRRASAGASSRRAGRRCPCGRVPPHCHGRSGRSRVPQPVRHGRPRQHRARRSTACVASASATATSFASPSDVDDAIPLPITRRQSHASGPSIDTSISIRVE